VRLDAGHTRVNEAFEWYLRAMAGRDHMELDAPMYRDFLSDAWMAHLLAQSVPVPGVDGLRQVGACAGLETRAALEFLRDLHLAVEHDLRGVLERRAADRAFIDERTRACVGLNHELGIRFRDAGYQTVIGMQDGDGRVVIGPLRADYAEAHGQVPIAPLPPFLQGHHVTLFGPPDDAKLSINAMNAFHRRIEGEPAIVQELLHSSGTVAMWGADDEDSKTPLRSALAEAGENLTRCLRGDLACTDARTGRTYALAADRRSRPIKRIPGLALPCAFLFRGGNPLPLHLYDFALHLFTNWRNPEALAFYVPKLENDEEAAYLAGMLRHAERLLAMREPAYRPGGIRLLIVLENPRAVFRLNEIIDALHPYFAGASLGWHDYLASTARLMKEDPNYRIPVKTDPEIVIKHIKASHELLARVVRPRGGISIGGMYGVLPSENRVESESFQAAIRGFFRDAFTQLKRGLDGFWVAHPDFVRLGLALVEAWKRLQTGERGPIEALVRGLLAARHQQPMLDFIFGPDIASLDRADPLYARALLAADRPQSDCIANDDPQEVRYNCFQCLQYLADWLCGNGCVALPAAIDGVSVRVMDDLATTERSRWEVWHEVRHGRVKVEDLVRIAHEEMHFIQKDRSAPGKAVQVKWDDRTRGWYPVAMHLMLQLMTAERPVEFASELLLPFTVESVRAAADPLAVAMAVEPAKYALSRKVARCHAAFTACGSPVFLRALADLPVLDLDAAERALMAFSIDDVNEAAGFHGDIGERRATLDARAAQEQAGMADEAESVQARLRELGAKYRARFGFKFLIAAKGKSGAEMLTALEARLSNSPAQELQHAREALWTIARQRLLASGADGVIERIREACSRHGVRGLSACVSAAGCAPQAIVLGEREPGKPVTPDTAFEIASLSKPLGACFAIEHFRLADIGLDTPVQPLLAACGSEFRLRSLDAAHAEWAEQVQLAHLMRHEALNMHYVDGMPADRPMPSLAKLFSGNAARLRGPVGVVNEPGKRFAYSGGGFMVLEHLLESRIGMPIHVATRAFLDALGMRHASFEQTQEPLPLVAKCFRDDGSMIEGGRLLFPGFAAGAVATPSDVGRFLAALTHAFHRMEGCGPISHDTAVHMLHGLDRGSRAFMGCDMGLGVFTLEAGTNRFAVHQGANDGCRALFAYCFDGPDAGCGVVICASGEEQAVACIAEVARTLLQHLGVRGIDWSRIADAVATSDVPPEERVNVGYRELLFRAFEADLPEAIMQRGAIDPLARFNHAVGAVIESVSNQRFARAENLISPHEPVFDPALFGRQGKVMDSWESVRHNPLGRDTLVLRLAKPAKIELVTVSTRFHLGNQAQAIELDGFHEPTGVWRPILARTPLQGHAMHALSALAPNEPFGRVRVTMFPDGGVTRLGLFGSEHPAAERSRLLGSPCVPFPQFNAQTRKPLAPKFTGLPREPAPGCDLASAAFGARIVAASNERYGPAAQVISPFPPLHMYDGLESARNREPDHSEHVTIALARTARIARIRIDFTHFVNNNPRELQIEGRAGSVWVTLAPRTHVKAFAGNSAEWLVRQPTACDLIRVTVYPDGGMNRIHVFETTA